ncbi:MAG: Gfo/Idh/MocA family oxidoreductase [Chitinophagaceae bacterium]|nr:Gfo/Idh/MocA family oxidoreductase [Chitinophagaceae bacterium]
MLKQSINWGIIGCGDVTEVKSGPAFNKIKNSSLVAVMRRDEAKAKDFALRHGVPKWYSNAEDLIKDDSIDAVYVATPPSSHELYATQAMLAGKNVYLEKPVTTNTLACKRLLEVEKQTGQKITVAHYRRALPLFEEIKKILDLGFIGKIRAVNIQFYQPHQSSLIANLETNWRIDANIAGAGLFYDIAPHQIDMLLFLFGERKSFFGKALNHSKLYLVEDTVSGIIHFQNDAVFSGNWCFTMPSMAQSDVCKITGENGNIEFSFYSNKFILNMKSESKTFEFNHPAHIQQPMIEKVVDYFLGNALNPCSLEEAYKSLQIMEGFVMNYKL